VPGLDAAACRSAANAKRAPVVFCRADDRRSQPIPNAATPSPHGASAATHAAAGDGSAPREHATRQRPSARDVYALPRSAPRRRRHQTALNASCSVAHRPAQERGTVPLRRNTLGRAAVATAAFLSALVTAPYGTDHAFPHHLHRRYAGNAESARRLIACPAPLARSPGEAVGRLFAHFVVPAPLRVRGQANAGLTEAEEDGRSAPATFSHIFTPVHLRTFTPSYSPIPDTKTDPTTTFQPATVQLHNGAARSSS